MHFIDFVKTAPDQPNKELQAIIDLIKNDAEFPKSSDPSKLAIYLYLKLNGKQTTAFQQLLMIYSQMPNKLPKRATAREDMLLDAINLVVNLQNSDSDYKYH